MDFNYILSKEMASIHRYQLHLYDDVDPTLDFAIKNEAGVVSFDIPGSSHITVSGSSTFVGTDTNIRREAADGSLSDSTLESILDTLDTSISVNNTSIGNEVIRATDAENVLDAKIDSEVATLEATDVSNSANILSTLSTNSTNAHFAEALIQASIDAEALRATTAENDSQAVLDALVATEATNHTTTTDAINTEISRALAAETAIQADVDQNETDAATALSTTNTTLQNNIDIITALISAQTTNATNAENLLQTNVNNLLANVDPSAIDSLQEVVNIFSSEDTSHLDLVNKLLVYVVEIQNTLDTLFGETTVLNAVLQTRYADLVSNLEGCYEFDSTQVGTDSSPYSYLLTSSGAITTGTSISGSTGVVFDGSSELTGQNNSHPILGLGLSFLFWMKPTALQRNSSFYPLRKSDTATRGWKLRWVSAADGGEKLEFEAIHAAGSRVYASWNSTIGDTLFDGQWHHLALTWDGMSKNTIKLCVDGNLQTVSIGTDELCSTGLSTLHTSPNNVSQVGVEHTWALSAGGITFGIDKASSFSEDTDNDFIEDNSHPGFGASSDEYIQANSENLVLEIDLSKNLQPVVAGVSSPEKCQWTLNVCTTPGDKTTATHTLLFGNAHCDKEEEVFTLAVDNSLFWTTWSVADEAAWVAAGHPAGTISLGSHVGFPTSDFSGLTFDFQNNLLYSICRYDDTASPLRIGSSFSGELDSVKIYSTPLSEASILAHRALLLPTSSLTVSTAFGHYAGEVSWLIEDADGVDIAELPSGHGYANNTTTATTTYQVQNGNYTLSLIDSWGDGWNGGVVNLESANSLTFGLTNDTTGLSGSAQFSMNSGTLSVISIVPDAIEIPAGSHQGTIRMVTSIGDISYTLTDSSGEIVKGPTNSTNQFSIYIFENETYTIDITDSGGDGSPSANHIYMSSSGGDPYRAYFPMPDAGSVTHTVTLSGKSFTSGYLRWIIYDTALTATQDWYMTDDSGVTVTAKAGDSYYYALLNGTYTIYATDTTPGGSALWATSLRIFGSNNGNIYIQHSGSEGVTEVFTLTIVDGDVTVS